MFSKESWKPINIDNDYLISSFGRVYSLKTSQFINPYIHKSRCSFYLRAVFGKRKKMVHILVAEHFHAEQKELLEFMGFKNLQVDHKDGNTLNPHKDNVEWVTPKVNIKRSYQKRMHPVTPIEWVEVHDD